MKGTDNMESSGNIYNQAYYHSGCGPIPYEVPDHWVRFFGEVADHIIEDLKPQTVLDAGCAMGYLVAALRDRGVEAYGVDISDYAISMVREDIKPYCKVGSLTEVLPEPLPRHYDLVVTIEVLEHLSAEDGKKAIANLCTLSDTILFTSTPSDFTEPTHINVQQREYWAKLFAENGYFDDLDTRPTYITSYAVCFRKQTQMVRQIEQYERFIRIAEDTQKKQLIKAKKRAATAAIFWGTAEQGLDEERKLEFEIDFDAGETYFHAQLPQNGVTTLRFDPTESPCIVEDLHFYSDRGTLQVIPENGKLIQGRYVFLERDPRFQVDLVGRSISEVTLRAHVIPLDYPENVELLAQLIASLDTAAQDQAHLADELRRQDEQYRAAAAQREADHQTQIEELSDAHSAQLEEMERTYLSKIDRLQADQDSLEKRYQETKGELEHYQTHYHAAIAQREDLKRQAAELQAAYQAISNATFWKLTKPARFMLDVLRKPFRNNKTLRLVHKGLRCWQENGFQYTWKKVQDKLHHRQDYLSLALRPLFTEEELAAQRDQVFPKKITFSIVVPLYNTPPKFLHEMIRSVIDQTYGDWELCMADGSDGDHCDVERICSGYVKKDHRIKYRKLEKNLGISGNTNACLEMATGDYIGLFDHDDLLHPAALHEVMKAVCEQDADFIYTDENTFHNDPRDAFCPHFKPDFAPDTLRSYNYICHFTVFSRQLLKGLPEGFRSDFDGSQDYDLILRLTEKAQHIVHIPKILYYWRGHSGSVASDISAKPYTLAAAKRALSEHLARVGLSGEVMDSVVPSTYQIKYKLLSTPLISILIPNKDHIDDLKKCISSIEEKTTYPFWEIIIIENNSVEEETFRFYESIQQKKNIYVVHWKSTFNYSAINNFGAEFAKGEHFILLNNDVEVISPDWIEQMLMFSQRHDVGAVGCMLYYPDDTIQHAGVILGIGGVGGHAHKYFHRGDYGYMSRLTIAQNYSAVTAACMMIPRHVWNEVGGLDESFAVAFNDVDLCMRIRKAGYLIVWTPYAELYHYESKSRGLEDTPEKKKRFEGEVCHFQECWAKELAAGDPYYNPNLTLEKEDFSLR